jgi:hypothetical protein
MISRFDTVLEIRSREEEADGAEGEISSEGAVKGKRE